MNLVNLLGVVWNSSYTMWTDAVGQRVIQRVRNPQDGPPPQDALGSFHTNVPQEPSSGNRHVGLPLDYHHGVLSSSRLGTSGHSAKP